MSLLQPRICHLRKDVYRQQRSFVFSSTSALFKFKNDLCVSLRKQTEVSIETLDIVVVVSMFFDLFLYTITTDSPGLTIILKIR
jgi:hypothetical protein